MSAAASAVMVPAAAATTALLLLLLLVVAVPAVGVLPVSAARTLLVVVALVPAAAVHVGGRVRVRGDVVPRAAAARRLSVRVFGEAAVELLGLLHAVELPHVVHLQAKDRGILRTQRAIRK